jgi:hypothetical protein
MQRLKLSNDVFAKGNTQNAKLEILASLGLIGAADTTDI